MMKRLSAIIFISMILHGSSIFALSDVELRYPTVEIAKDEEALTAVRKAAQKPSINMSASLLFGYDDNARLDHYDGVGSMFFQEAVGISGKYPINDTLAIRGSYDLTSINYFRTSDTNLMDNLFDVGIDKKIADNITWSLDYRPDIVDLPHNELGKYTEHLFETSLRHDISKRIYQKITYGLSTKHYPKWPIRNNGGVFKFGKRNDLRNTVTHRLGLYLTDNIFLKEENEFYYNYSNEQYLEYYDCTSFITRTTLIHFTTKKLYEVANFSYQYTPYTKRTISDEQEKQRDNIFTFGGSIFYDFTTNVTVGTNFNYKKSFSNEGVNNYYDFIVSSGIYCRF
ncbi:MAG: hypothetical protein KKI13_07270 [Candidatus Omnitrophica bacterium]|nr:hypothetical protein [Candidatus Omnitrophota bacterium]MCG2705203.1 hypothetical protein [Candidatus Omnitrophota bacterium]